MSQKTLSRDVELRIPLHPRQERAINSPAYHTLFGGAAGGGKSYLIRAAAVTWCMAVPGLIFYLFRRTYGDLKANHFEGYMNFNEMLAPLVAAGKCRITEKAIRFPNKSVITLNHLGSAQDLLRYQGRQIHALGIDEATHFTDEEIRYLFSRMRLGGLTIPPSCPWSFPRSILSTNPGGIGHHWAKEGFVDKGAFKVTKANSKNGGKTRVFVPSLLKDNPTMSQTDPDYAATLSGLGDPILVRAMLDGDWTIVAGSMFGDTWRNHLHTCDPFPIPADWMIWRGADDGFADPAAVVWITMDPRTGTHYIIDELYRNKMLPEEFARRVKTIDGRIMRTDQNGKLFENRQALTGVLDSAAFGNDGTGIPRGKVLNSLGLMLRPCIKWTGCRASYAQHFHRLMAPNPKTPIPGQEGQFYPSVRVFRNRCIEFIKRVPALPRDPRDHEVIDDNAEDHIFDAAIYGLMWKTNEFRRAAKTGL